MFPLREEREIEGEAQKGIMFIQEISISIESPDADNDYIIDEFDMLMSHYRGSGQTQGRVESQYVKDNKIVCLPYTLEKTSLDPKYDNFYVDKKKKEVEELCNAKLQFKTLGKSHPAYEGPCNCGKSSFYILITNFRSIDSPLNCGDCNDSIPLYRLPKYYDYGYMPILSWESNYQSCDHLQMNCEVGERWALNQMENVNSQLSKQGIAICKKLAEQNNIPVYYYLFNYEKYRDKKENIKCPLCNNNWDLNEQLHGQYDFKCDRCRLVSVVSPYS